VRFRQLRSFLFCSSSTATRHATHYRAHEKCAKCLRAQRTVIRRRFARVRRGVATGMTEDAVICFIVCLCRFFMLAATVGHGNFPLSMPFSAEVAFVRSRAAEHTRPPRCTRLYAAFTPRAARSAAASSVRPSARRSFRRRCRRHQPRCVPPP